MLHRMTRICARDRPTTTVTRVMTSSRRRSATTNFDVWNGRNGRTPSAWSCWRPRWSLRWYTTTTTRATTGASNRCAFCAGYNYTIRLDSTNTRRSFDARSTGYQSSLSCRWSNPLTADTLTYLFRPQCSRPRTLVGVTVVTWVVEWSSHGRIAVESKSNRSRNLGFAYACMHKGVATSMTSSGHHVGTNGITYNMTAYNAAWDNQSTFSYRNQFMLHTEERHKWNEIELECDRAWKPVP